MEMEPGFVFVFHFESDLFAGSICFYLTTGWFVIKLEFRCLLAWLSLCGGWGEGGSEREGVFLRTLILPSVEVTDKVYCVNSGSVTKESINLNSCH